MHRSAGVALIRDVGIGRSGRIDTESKPRRTVRGTHDVIADMKLRDVRPHFNHDSCDLMTQHGRYWNDIVSREQEVGVTQA